MLNISVWCTKADGLPTKIGGSALHISDAPIKTGKVVGMRKSYGKGLANHTGPESCGISGNTGIEALTGVCTGWVLSPEM